MTINQIISEQANNRDVFFQQLLSRGKEGKIIFPNPHTWSIALSRDILMTIVNLADNFFELSYQDWENFFNIYISNWNNDVNQNPNVYEQEVIYARDQFIRSICYYGSDPAVRIDFIGQARTLLQGHPEAIGAYFSTNDPSVSTLVPWNNQMTIDECY